MSLSSVSRRGALLVAAALVGAGGLAGESILVSCAGLALGFSRASAAGLAVFVAGYALGAWRAGQSRRPVAPWLAACALFALVLPWLGVRDLLGAAASGRAAWLAGTTAVLFLGAAGLAQGALLPALLRIDARFADSRAVALLFAANLAGSQAGARWIGFDWVAEFGRSSAALAAGATAALGALLAAALARASREPLGAPRAPASRASPESPASRESRESPGSPGSRASPGSLGSPESPASLGSLGSLGSPGGRRAGTAAAPDARLLPHGRAALLAGLGTAWAVSAEWLALRHALLWLESQEATLNAVLAASLAALAAGALASGLLPRGRAGVLALVPVLVLGTAWLAYGAEFAQARAGESRFLFALWLVGPALAGFGAWIPALYRASGGEVGARLGGLLLHEAWGALLGAPLVHAFLVPHFGLAGALGSLALLGAVFALLAAPPGAGTRAATAATVLGSLAAAVLLARAVEPALRSPLYTDPALHLRSFAEDAQFAVGVVDDGIQGERTLLTDRFRAAGTGRDYAYMRALGHLPLLLHPAPKRVAVMCLGTGTTLGAAFLHPEVERLEVLEISPAVVAAAPWFEAVHRGALAPAAQAAPGGTGRVHVRLGDGRRLLADRPGAFDVVTMEPLLPDSPFGVYLYTREFYAVAKRALAPGGLVCQWVPPHALEPRVFDAVCESFSHAFPWSGRFLFGTQLLLIGAEREPALDPARFPAEGSQLQGELAAVNLERPGGVLTAFCGAAAWPAPPRPLSDDAPWIVFLDKPRGPVVFEWLGANLRRLAEVGGPLPEAWKLAVGERADAFLRAGRLVLRGRTEAAEAEARVRRGAEAAGEWLVGSEVARELASAPEAGELGRSLLDEQRFLAHLRLGVALVPTDARRAADQLLEAALLRRERADVHLYVSAALLRLGDERGARAALARALELCPRAIETPAGRRASTFGLPGPER